MELNKYKLPKLNYGYNELAPHISEEQLKIHHEKHHQAYVNGANVILEKIDKARSENFDLDMKATLKELSFNIGGHILHSLFWENLRPTKQAREIPEKLMEQIKKDFGSMERFKKEFSQTAQSVEGSGWAALTFCRQTGRLILMQIEKHNTNIYPLFGIILVLDVFEHAYYLDYKNERTKFIEAFWKIINWQEVGRRYEGLLR